MAVALAAAFVLHAGLLLVRFAADPVTLPPPIDAIIFPTRSVVMMDERIPEPPERFAPIEARDSIPVPAYLVPEPMERVTERRIETVVELPVGSINVEIPEPPPIPETGPRRFSSAMERPVRQGGAEPSYTAIARRAGEQGVVILDAVIDTSGRVTEIDVLRGLRFGLTESAVRAVRTWRFEPARLNGRPVAVRYNLTIRFALE
jgi:protein TonB